MTDDQFWTLIASLDGVADAHTTSALVDHLATAPPEAIEAFDLSLRTAVRDLDPRRFAMMPVRDVTDPPSRPPVPLLGDALEAFLLAVVAAGGDTYDAARTNPTDVTRRSWTFSESDRLLDVAPQAYERTTGLMWESTDSVSAPAPDDNGPSSGPAAWCRPPTSKPST